MCISGKSTFCVHMYKQLSFLECADMVWTTELFSREASLSVEYKRAELTLGEVCKLHVWC